MKALPVQCSHIVTSPTHGSVQCRRAQGHRGDHYARVGLRTILRWKGSRLREEIR